MSTAPAPQPDNAVRWAHHPADQLAHLSVHTPIQVPRGAADGHHPAAMLQPGSFQLQQGTPFTGLDQAAQYQRSFPHNFPVQNGGAFAQLSAAQLQQHNQAAAQQPNYELFAQRFAAEQQQRLQQLQQQPQIVDTTWFDAQKTQSAWPEIQTSPQRPQLQRPQSAQQSQPPHSQVQLLSPQPAYHHALLSPTHGNPLWQQHTQSQRAQLHLTPPRSSPSSTVTTTPTPQSGLLSTLPLKRSPSVGEQERRRSPMAPQGARSCFTSPQPENATVKSEEHRSTEETTATAATNQNGEDSGNQLFEKMRTILDFEPVNQDPEHNANRESVEKARSLEASRLLLNLSGSEHSEPSGEENGNEEITVDCSDATAPNESSSQPQHASETSVDAVIASVLTSIASPISGAAAGANSTATASENGTSSNGTAQKHRSYFRPPGLGAPTDASSDSNVLVCNVCGFSCTSKFHYNSHMNTHSDHKCTICNYTSRTEGRLKKHVMDSHTQEDRIAAGLDVSTSTGSSNGGSDSKDFDKLQQELSSTMSSLLESANRIVATEANGETATSMTPTSVTVNVSASNGDSIPHSSDSAFSVSNPLENIRALAEKNGLLNGSALDPSSLSSTLSGLLNGTDANGNGAETSGLIGKKEQRRSGAGKPKTYRCKQCQHVSSTKEEQWRHARTHIPLEKQLTCELCEFVTEYKHHLEYHIRNHKGEKPFGCKECNYQCVNKSMLNSHMKSHNSLYQFKCMDCAYQTKYCHSLKMHLHKYNHRRAPGTVMSDGDANETDHFEDPSESGTSMALQQLSQQFRADPSVASDDMHSLSTPVTSVRDTLRSILQPMVTSAPMQQQYAMQALRQQQIDRMQEMIRNANFNVPMFPCQLCDFSTADRDELHRHQMVHLQAIANNNNLNLAGHPTLASLLANQNLQNGGPLILPHMMQQQQPLMQTNTLNSAALQQVNMLREQLARHYAASQDRSVSDAQHSTSLNHSSSEYGAYGGADERARPATETSHDADESSSSPTGSKMSVDESGSPASDIAPDGSSRKRKGQKNPKKLEDTVKRLREKSSPESDEHEFSADSGHSDAAGSSTAIVASLPQPIPTSFFTSLSNTAPQERQRSSSTMYTCQHCAITFQDLALYQIHLGYHSFDNPYKCNRCGNVSQDSLKFNLHLYQDKHDML